MSQFASAGYLPAIRKHIDSGKPFMAICVGLQVLFEGSSESPTIPGIGVIKGYLDRFDEKYLAGPIFAMSVRRAGPPVAPSASRSGSDTS